MIYVWLLAGVAGVLIAFLMPDSTDDLWPAMNAAGVVLVVYLAALLAYILRPPIPVRKRILAGSIAVVTCIAGYSLWTGHQEQSHYQHDRLIEIRSTIGRGRMVSEVPKTLLPVLETYHAQGTQKKRSIGSIFRDLYEGVEIGRDFYSPMWEHDTQTVYIPLRIEDDLVELITVDKVGRGKDLSFANTGGTVGRIEERFTLTEKGVSHDVIN